MHRTDARGGGGDQSAVAIEPPCLAVVGADQVDPGVDVADRNGVGGDRICAVPDADFIFACIYAENCFGLVGPETIKNGRRCSGCRRN